MRIAIDARLVGAHSTGDSTYWTALLQGFSKLDCDAEFLLLSNAERPQEIPEDPRFTFTRVPGRGRWWSLVDFPLAARRAGADVIHTQYNLSPLTGGRGVTTIHDVSFFVGPEWFSRKDRMLLSRFVPPSARRAAAVITVSETSKGEIEAHIPVSRGKTFAIPLACPPWISRSSPEEVQLVRERFGLSEPYLLTVGTRWPRKNMGLAVEAVGGLPTEYPHRLVITGKPGWGEQSLDERVLPTGYVDENTLSALYSGAELYLAPSHHEGFGLTVLEAFACDCPVVCSDGGALPETAGGAARVLPRTVSAWKQGIGELLQHSSKLEALRLKGRERVRDFSWEETARRTLEVYRKVFERDRS